MTASTYSRAPVKGDGFEEVAGEQRISLGPEKVSPGVTRALGRRVHPGLPEDLPHGGGGDPEDKELTVDPAIAPAGILPYQVRHQSADGGDGVRSARALRT
jgi:hypothetical protein